MSTTKSAVQQLDPEFYGENPTEEDVSYDRWFRAKVQEALDNPSPGIPHDEAMARIDAKLEARKKARSGA